MKSLKIKKGLFLKEDFKKLPNGVIIYIESGKLIID